MEWRVCERFPLYEISEYGDLRRLVDSPTRSRGYFAKLYVNSDGYLATSLNDADGKSRNALIHILVAEAFIGPKPSDCYEVAHNSGSRIGNHYTNLRWDTRKGNHEDLQEHGTALKGEKNGRAKITEDDVRFIRREYPRIKASRGVRKVSELDDMFDLSRSTIIDIAKKKSWQHVE